MSENTIKQKFENNLQVLNDNYTVVANYHIGTSEKRIVLKDSHPYKCRFCGKQKTAKEFKKVAHVLSRCIGNNTLFSAYECDECNGKVFAPFESNLSEYMKLFHTFSRIRGYNGVPSYKANCHESTRVDYVDDKFQIKSFEGESPIAEINEDAKNIKIQGKRSYVPTMVYKALVKMALSVLPEVEMVNFSTTLSWLQGADLKNRFMVKYKMFGGYHRFSDVTMVVMKRRDDCKINAPAYIFELAYGYFTFSSYIPFCSLDKDLQGKKVELIPIVCPFDSNARPIEEKWLDFSSNEKVSKEEISLTLSFESLEKEDLMECGKDKTE